MTSDSLSLYILNLCFSLSISSSIGPPPLFHLYRFLAEKRKKKKKKKTSRTLFLFFLSFLLWVLGFFFFFYCLGGTDEGIVVVEALTSIVAMKSALMGDVVLAKGMMKGIIITKVKARGTGMMKGIIITKVIFNQFLCFQLPFSLCIPFQNQLLSRFHRFISSLFSSQLDLFYPYLSTSQFLMGLGSTGCERL